MWFPHQRDLVHQYRTHQCPWQAWKGHPGKKDELERWLIRVLVHNHFPSRVGNGWGGKAWKEDWEAECSGLLLGQTRPGPPEGKWHLTWRGRKRWGEERMSPVTEGCGCRGLESCASCCHDRHPQAKPLHTSSGIQLFFFFFQKLIFFFKKAKPNLIKCSSNPLSSNLTQFVVWTSFLHIFSYEVRACSLPNIFSSSCRTLRRHVPKAGQAGSSLVVLWTLRYST